MIDNQGPIKRDRVQKYGRKSGLQEAKSFAERNGMKTLPLLTNKHKNKLYRKNIERNAKSSSRVIPPEERKFKLSTITGIGNQTSSVATPFLPSSRIMNPPQPAKSKYTSFLGDMYNKLLSSFDKSTDQAIGGALGFTNRNVVPGFTQNTSSGLSRFDVGNGDPFKYSNRFMKGDLDDLRAAYINEAAKGVKVRGDNVNPFDNSRGARNLGRLRQLQNRINGGGQADLIRESNSIRSQLDDVKGRQKSIFPPRNIAQGQSDYESLVRQQESLEARQVGVNRKLERNARILSTTNDYSGATHTKGFLPKEGVGGYGLGVNNYLAASRKELFVRGLGFTGGILGPSGAEALMNSFGIVTAKQRAVTQSKGLLGKMFSAGFQAPLMTYGSLLFTASSGGDLSDFVETQLTYAGGLQGWRIGSSVGGMLTKGTGANLSQIKGGNMISAMRAQGGRAVLRGAAGVVGGVTGFALGAGLVAGASWLAQDISSNRSTIRKIAKDFTTKTATMNTQNTRQSLTMRQMAISKLAKSGLNDRATLLGNESRVLKGLM